MLAENPRTDAKKDTERCARLAGEIEAREGRKVELMKRKILQAGTHTHTLSIARAHAHTHTHGTQIGKSLLYLPSPEGGEGEGGGGGGVDMAEEPLQQTQQETVGTLRTGAKGAIAAEGEGEGERVFTPEEGVMEGGGGGGGVTQDLRIGQISERAGQVGRSLEIWGVVGEGM